jgi:glycosyltransferase involved in cell wall biosynthesis
MTDAGRLKVLLVSPIPYGDEGSYGGGERYALELASAIAKQHETRLVSFAARQASFRRGELTVFYEKYRCLIRRDRLNPLNVGFLRHLAWCDLVHCVGWNGLVIELAILAARLQRKPAFVTDIGGGAAPTMGRLLPMASLVSSFLMIGYPPKSIFDRHRRRWVAIGSGVDVESYRPDPAISRQGVLFIGRLLPHKGIDYLIEAVDHDTDLTIVGRPMHADFFLRLQALAAGKRVRFLTDLSDEETLVELQTAKVLALPSVERSSLGGHTPLPEYHGLVLLEALACGTPVICTSVGLMPELVDGSCGRVVPPNDAAALGTAIREILSDQPLWQSLSKGARGRAELWSWDRVADRCGTFYLGGGSAGV